LPEPDGPVTAVRRPLSKTGVEAVEDAGRGRAAAVRLDDAGQRRDRPAGQRGRGDAAAPRARLAARR
jgi:hypothetical protein